MCYVHGSIDQAIGVCPMCKVFKPSGSRCPHIKDVCRNRTYHPRHDVVFLRNAEVQHFSGCGYCKWGRTNPPPKLAGYHNPGWPGCCRPPTSSENRWIGAADWPAVSLVHHVPIPPDVKAILESLTSSSRLSPAGGFSTGSLRGSSSQTSPPSMPRRGSYNVATVFSRTESTPSRTLPVSVPTKSRSGGSPQQLHSSLVANIARDLADVTSSSLPNTSAIDQFVLPRRSIDTSDRRPDLSYEPRYSPGQKNADLGGTLSRKGSGPIASSERRPSISAAAPSMSLTKVTVDAQPQRRRAGTATGPPPNLPSTRTSERPSTGTPSRRSLEASMAAMKVSSASSDSSGSASETTVVSDGGFTDYLSDESEAELQRQAEIKAALVAQNYMEEEEFKAARRKLANVDLRPPQSWTGAVNRS